MGLKDWKKESPTQERGLRGLDSIAVESANSSFVCCVYPWFPLSVLPACPDWSGFAPVKRFTILFGSLRGSTCRVPILCNCITRKKDFPEIRHGCAWRRATRVERCSLPAGRQTAKSRQTRNCEPMVHVPLSIRAQQGRAARPRQRSRESCRAI